MYKLEQQVQKRCIEKIVLWKQYINKPGLIIEMSNQQPLGRSKLTPLQGAPQRYVT